MMVESRGWVAPPPIRRYLTLAEVDTFARIADERSNFRKYATKRSTWAQGFNPAGIRMSLIAEWVAADWLTHATGYPVSPDFDLHAEGDPGYDLLANGIRIEVKCRTSSSARHGLLLRRRDDAGNLLPIKWDVVLAATWTSADLKTQMVCLSLDGCLDARTFCDRASYGDAVRGVHKNLRVRNEQLDGLDSLRDLVQIGGVR